MSNSQPLFPEASACLAKKYCSASIYTALQTKVTKSGFTLTRAIQSGITNVDSNIGIYAGDAESYEIFSALFGPIIEEYHGAQVTPSYLHDVDEIQVDNPDPEAKFILSTRIRAARNVSGFDFTPHIKKDDRLKLEETMRQVFAQFPDELQGEYFSFAKLTAREKKELHDKKLLFPRGDRFQDAAGINRDFPIGRGIFLSKDKQLRIWVNEEDHLRIICQNTTADLNQVYVLFCKAHQALENSVDFSKSKPYGFLTACPTNIGTSMRAGVHIRLNRLNDNKKLLEEITHQNNLQIRGTHGEKTEVMDSVFDLSNRQRFGISEVEIIRTLYQGISAIIDAEKES